MTPIIRILTAAVRANPALAAAVALEVGILLSRAIKSATGNSAVGRSAKSLEKTLLAYKPEVQKKPATRRSRRMRSA
jgi:hypothetical protein